MPTESHRAWNEAVFTAGCLVSGPRWAPVLSPGRTQNDPMCVLHTSGRWTGLGLLFLHLGWVGSSHAQGCQSGRGGGDVGGPLGAPSGGVLHSPCSLSCLEARQ